MRSVLRTIWIDDNAANVVEYAVGMAVLMMVLVGLRLADVNARELLADMGIRLKAARP